MGDSFNEPSTGNLFFYDGSEKREFLHDSRVFTLELR